MIREIAQEHLDLRDFVREGDTVTWGQACAEPLCLTEKLLPTCLDIGHFRVFVGLTLSQTLRPQYLAAIDVMSYGSLGTAARLGTELQILPCNYSALPRLIANRTLPIDTVLVQLSPRGPDGHYSLGFASDYLIPAMRAARVVIGEVNDRVPCTTLAQPLDESLLDVVVHCSRQPLYTSGSIPGSIEQTIATLLQDVIEDGSVIQYGIGSVPSAILAALSGHKALGIHSGMLTDDIIPLMESGALTNETNKVRAGRSIGALAIGSERLSRALHLNPDIELHPVTTTHDCASLARQDRLVAINSAVEIDLYGQVNAEMVGRRYLGAVGGQVDFMHAASTQERGLSIIAMPATAGKDKRSRIVSQLSAPIVTTAKSDVDIVATEYGIADLRGKTIVQRARAISALAAPQHRDELVHIAG
ncbi:MAG: acetyl-CoA hydrolase/transferase family protein, partial [Halioglobus sp.]|nr:acetyl-CoA hydrolase/transferase family protein [Halioglobus sp.]